MEGDGAESRADGVLHRHVPQLAVDWIRDEPERRWRVVDGTLCFADISGFTALVREAGPSRPHRRRGAGRGPQPRVRRHARPLRRAGRPTAEVRRRRPAVPLPRRRTTPIGRQARPPRCATSCVRRRPSRRRSDGCGCRCRSASHSGADRPVPRRQARTASSSSPVRSSTRRSVPRTRRSAGEILVDRRDRSAAPRRRRRSARRRATAPCDGGGRRPLLAPLPIPSSSLADAAPRALAARPARPCRWRRVPSPATASRRSRSSASAAIGGLLDDGRRRCRRGARTTFIRVVQEAFDVEQVTLLTVDIDVDGGKVFCSTGAPTASEDDEDRMLRALRRIVATPLPLTLQTGVNRGHVFVAELGTARRAAYSAMGDTTNTAARIAAQGADRCALRAPERARARADPLRRPPGRPVHDEGQARAAARSTRSATTSARASRSETDVLPMIGREVEAAAAAGR